MADKRLGQHWLSDQASLQAIVDFTDISPGDNLLEIGPGLGHLTNLLLETGAQLTAIEYDRDLISRLKSNYCEDQITIVFGDIRKYDFQEMPPAYKICANIPYYLTAYLLRKLIMTSNKPAVAVLLLQKEVTARLTRAGRHSLLSVLLSAFYQLEAGLVVPADLFEPPPKVDSQAIRLTCHQQPQVPEQLWPLFERVIKAGFASPRKQLYHNLAAGFQQSKPDTKAWLASQDVDFSLRAEQLSIDQWLKLAQAIDSHRSSK